MKIVSDQKGGVVVTFGNLVERAGTTTNSTMLAYALAEIGYKVLLSDQDPKANATILYLMTQANKSKEIYSFDKTLMTAILDEDLRGIVTEIKENLFLLPSFSDFSLYPRFLEKRFSNEIDRVHFFRKLLQPLKEDFDFIFIDVPSTISLVRDSAFYASDFVVMVLRTDEKCSLQIEDFIMYLRSLVDKYEADCEIMGILPVPLLNGANGDVINLENAKKIFDEEYFFETRIKYKEGLKQFTVTGITNKDIYDKRIHEMYQKLADDFLLHLNRKLERKVVLVEESYMKDPDNELKLEEIEVEKKHSLKKKAMSKKEKTSATLRKDTLYKLNGLVHLDKGDTIDHLLDIYTEKVINTELTNDEKKILDSYIKRMKQKDKKR